MKHENIKISQQFLSKLQMVNRLQIQETRSWSQTKLRVINVNNGKIKNKKWNSDNLKTKLCM